MLFPGDIILVAGRACDLVFVQIKHSLDDSRCVYLYEEQDRDGYFLIRMYNGSQVIVQGIW